MTDNECEIIYIEQIALLYVAEPAVVVIGYIDRPGWLPEINICKMISWPENVKSIKKSGWIQTIYTLCEIRKRFITRDIANHLRYALCFNWYVTPISTHNEPFNKAGVCESLNFLVTWITPDRCYVASAATPPCRAKINARWPIGRRDYSGLIWFLFTPVWILYFWHRCWTLRLIADVVQAGIDECD